MQAKRFLTFILIALSTLLYSQTAVGLKVRGFGFHFIDMEQDATIYENSITGTQSAIIEPGYELSFQQFFYATTLSVEVRQGFHSDAAAKLAGHLGVGLRWKFFHQGRNSISISATPLFTFRNTWDDIPQYKNKGLYRDYDNIQTYQYKFLIGTELIYNLYISSRSDLSFALSYNNSYQTVGFSIGYRYWINPYVKVNSKKCSSCGNRWNQGRFRKFWKRVWRF